MTNATNKLTDEQAVAMVEALQEYAKARWGTQWPDIPGKGMRVSPRGLITPRWQSYLGDLLRHPSPMDYLKNNKENN